MKIETKPTEFELKFPEHWTCLLCSPIAEFPRKEILTHCRLAHDMDDLTWQKLYERLAPIGGV